MKQIHFWFIIFLGCFTPCVAQEMMVPMQPPSFGATQEMMMPMQTVPSFGATQEMMMPMQTVPSFGATQEMMMPMQTVPSFGTTQEMMPVQPMSSFESPWEPPNTGENIPYPDVSIESYFVNPYEEKPANNDPPPEEPLVAENFKMDHTTPMLPPPPFSMDRGNLESYYDEQPISEKPPYRLRVGDRLMLSVYGQRDTRRLALVDVTGSISYLFINSLPAVGRTIDEIRHDIEEKLKTYYRNPVLIATAVDLAPDFYTIVGEVKLPGKRPLRGNATVLTALSAAGGFTTRIFRNQTIDLVDLDHSFLARKGQMVPIDFVRLVRFGDVTQDIPLMAGDYLFMATSTFDKVYVLGEVLGPTSIEIIDTISLAEALTFAGGVTLRASSRVAVIRGSLGCPETFLVDINRILKGKACDFRLCPGDIVYVPARKFTMLRELVQEGIRAFVSIVASIAGTSAFIAIQPNACNILSPVPVISTGGVTTGTFITPAGGAVGGTVVGVP